MTGYEPYLAGPYRVFQFTGAPGELRTTQWEILLVWRPVVFRIARGLPAHNELMTLVGKNANGHWIFRRNSYGAQLAIPNGPVTLWWVSDQSSIPPGGTTANSSLAAYWNALSGCGGATGPAW